MFNWNAVSMNNYYNHYVWVCNIKSLICTPYCSFGEYHVFTIFATYIYIYICLCVYLYIRALFYRRLPCGISIVWKITLVTLILWLIFLTSKSGIFYLKHNCKYNKLLICIYFNYRTQSEEISTTAQFFFTYTDMFHARIKSNNAMGRKTTKMSSKSTFRRLK